MPKIGINPSAFVHTLKPVHKEWVQGVHKILAGSVDLGVPKVTAPDTAGVNAGVYTQFEKGNGSGILIRIAAYGITDSGASYIWPSTANTGIDIAHGLLRQPIGFHVVDSDKDARVYRTAPPTSNLITLASSDPSASITLYIF